MDLPAAARAWLESPEADAPRPDDPSFAGDTVAVIAAAEMSLQAAAAAARAAGIAAHILSDELEGEARDVGSAPRGARPADGGEGRALRPALRHPLRRRDDGDARCRRARAAGEGATPSSCCRSPSGSPASTASRRLRPTPTASTAARTMPARSATATRSRRLAALGRRREGLSFRPRCLYGFLPARRPRRHRADAHQRQRFQGHLPCVIPATSRPPCRRRATSPSFSTSTAR